MRKSAKKIIQYGHDLLFKNVHSRQLIYNTCWEDPRIDRELLGLNSKSKIVMITSAGCNALDYLLDSPAEIHAVDMNPRQNALLELKLSLYKNGNYDALWSFFGHGRHKHYKKIFNDIKKHIPYHHQLYWKKNISYFSPGGVKKTFYYRGTAGTAAWIFKKCIMATKRKIRHKFFELFEAESVSEQKEIYSEIENKLWDFFISWFVKQPVVMAMLGVPRPQIKLILDGHPEGLLGYVKDKMRQVFTEIPICDNYFWRVYLHGEYTQKCRPNYLDDANFATYCANIDRIKTYTNTISGFLKKHPCDYTHYILLDHQDWMAYHNPPSLEEEWHLILENSLPGTKILFRSAGLNADFIPKVVAEHLEFDFDRCEKLHRTDRVGTYGSLYLARVK